MNRTFYSLLAVVAILLWSGPAGARTMCSDPEKTDSATVLRLTDTLPAADSLERIDAVDTDLVALHRTSRGDEVVLEVGVWNPVRYVLRIPGLICGLKENFYPA